jgi:hypothetical protein
MGRPLAHLALRACGGAAVLLGAMLIAARSTAAQPADQSAPQDSHSLQQVQVTASKLDRRTLKRATTQFVKLHGAVSPDINQVGRWQADVCPKVTGLRPAAGALVSRRVEQVARSVGAPTGGVGKRCAVNVEIVFTPEPQQLLNHIAKAYPALLGSSQSAGDIAFRHAIQSWYVSGAKPVAEWNETTGASDFLSYFTRGRVSEFLHVLVVVDTRKVAGDSLRSISDYIAMLALTRMGPLDACSDLPSIIDLLSSGCDERRKPQALTDADTAYLKALYSSNLEMKLYIEQVDMRDRMVKVIMGR